MTSAALQTGLPPAVAALNSLPASPSARHYASSSHSSPTREGYHANHSGSPQSSRRPSRSGNGTAPHSPAPLSQANSPMSSRAAVASPVAVAAASSPDYRPGSSDRRRHVPPVAPPRTSSNRHDQATSATAPSSRRGVADRAAAGSSRQPQDPHANHDAGSSQDESAARQKTRAHARAAPQEPPQRTSSSRDPRAGAAPTAAAAAAAAASLPIRAQPPPTATASSSKGPSRETSEILNSMVVTRDEDDIEREKERMAMAKPHHQPDEVDDAAPPPVVSPTTTHSEDTRRTGRSRQDHSRREKHTKFGEYILGNTIGEGEFGKVKLGWKQDGGVQVAIKLIKKDAVGSNPTRMAKIMREVHILKKLRHPNIVQLHKMEESERHFGIVLEYASGGELFDYILNHRYLKDNAAKRLFAQLISGVGYLHKRGIVHRDLKLENLLLDRNRNIIITDFGFANTFDPLDELTEEEENHLWDRDYVKSHGLDKIKPSTSSRKGDLMQTSCGSPCYAAPELVVSDSLYTGRKVDVWSCGVILYAMLAGYLPFDDDPANPEGDNINLLYKYIVSTPLTFPEYVTPHARDLLRRILVPDPRKRADLFEVARHSWLSEYAHVVELITSTTTSPNDVQNIPLTSDEMGDNVMLGRSASVREASKKAVVSPTIGGLTSKQGNIDPEAEAAIIKQQKDNKRRTVQVEYVAPVTQTQRGETASAQATPGKTRARSGSQGPVEVAASQASPKDKPLPRDPPVPKDAYGKPVREARLPPSSHRNQNMPPARPNREGARAASDHAFMTSAAGTAAGRPTTGGSMASTGSKGPGAGARASYGQPLPPAVADTNALGRIQQPKAGPKNYVISNPIPQDAQSADYGRHSASVPAKFARVSGFAGEGEGAGAGGDAKGHRRSNTIGEIGGKIFGRSGSIFGRGNRKRSDQPQPQPQPQPQQAGEKSRRYPPVSMSNAMAGGEDRRTSMDSKRSRRSFSLGLGKKRSGSISGSQTSQEKPATRRFSLIPGSFSLKAIGIGKDYGPAHDSQQDLPIQEPPPRVELGPTGPDLDGRELDDGMYAHLSDPQQASVAAANSSPVQPRFAPGRFDHRQRPSGVPNYMQQGAVLNTGSDSSVDKMHQNPPRSAPYTQREFGNLQNQEGGRRVASRPNRGVLQKNKRLDAAYDTDEYSRPHDHSGSSGAARRVMDFFRRRGKARGGEDR